MKVQVQIYLCEFCYKISFAFLGVYISETVHPKVRGSLLVVRGLFSALGKLFTWIVAYFLSWRETSYVLMITPSLMVIIMLFLPESPYWLIEVDQTDAAR